MASTGSAAQLLRVVSKHAVSKQVVERRFILESWLMAAI
tara:strand:- start:254 stop:370 length:117 start_codon:yes stop_codon:yes gene_type:complete